MDRLSKAWRAGDGNAWAAEFADDADFTVWFGMSFGGADEFARGHQRIFDTFYANTSIDLGVRQLRFLGENAAVAHLAGAVTPGGEEPPAEPHAVFEKIGDEPAPGVCAVEAERAATLPLRPIFPILLVT